jgi:hypothetical protein
MQDAVPWLHASNPQPHPGQVRRSRQSPYKSVSARLDAPYRFRRPINRERKEPDFPGLEYARKETCKYRSSGIRRGFIGMVAIPRFLHEGDSCRRIADTGVNGIVRQFAHAFSAITNQ